MAGKEDKTFSKDFRRFFFRGLATVLPAVLTIVLLVKGYEIVYENISVHITNTVIRVFVLSVDDYPELSQEEKEDYQNRLTSVQKKEFETKTQEAADRDERAWKLSQRWNHGPHAILGFFFAILLVYIVGRLLGSLLGRKLWNVFESAIGRIPGIGQVYPHVKQVTDYIFGNDKKVEFTRVVAVPYPRKGIWSIGLVTGDGMKHLSETQKEEYLTIFIPSSPTPVTGYVIHVEKTEVIDLPISIEEALRFTVSGGVIVPEKQALSPPIIEIQPAPKASGDSKKKTHTP
ncbi:MAG: DUF502 domain-containing protein [Phycisphaerae bacterium]|nr:DUF502 domain-containing protein [Phycisphaerae bacterium]